ncbi:hypothetical protein [Streptomyces sp. NPDC050560]|uniref:hypothetical protein n=1 Tax=Streptomyces sp. NPDC050560 TaxID=3365630 RepID=UPI0037905CB7
MGSLRNPVGPLPSSIYWRRRAVIASAVVIVALLVVWLVSMGGDGGKGQAGHSDGKHPAPSITPGPSSSGPAISEHPGGRDESGGGGDGGKGGSDGGSGGSSSGAGGASGSDGGSAGGSDGGGGAGGGSGTGGAGDRVPAGSSLPVCTPDAVSLSFRATTNTYESGQRPKLRLTATNKSAADCKLDLGPEKTVLTITKSDDQVWASDDCPEDGGSLMLKVPAGSSITRTVEWDREGSAPHCGKPAVRSAPAGTYLVEARAPGGFAKLQTSFVLAKD